MDLPDETRGAERDAVFGADRGAALMMVKSARRVVVDAANVEYDVGGCNLGLVAGPELKCNCAKGLKQDIL